MTDTHCHLDFCDDPAAAADPDLAAIITVGTTVARSERSVGFAERLTNVWAAAGIHPNDAGDAAERTARERLEALAAHPRVVAVGETGFDFYWDRVSEEVQEASFRWQVALAARLDKPVILHVRDKAGEERAALASARLLAELGWPKGILHCFSGHPALLETGLVLGWLVSFAGNLTYKKATAIQEAARTLDKDRLLLETDSPFLPPQPKRGQPNRPAYVRYTAEFLAGLRGETPAEVEAYTDANARRVYGLPQPG
ncbi:TatD family hydrolase [soil metagenome]|jgi:TatD DNase family protein